MYLFVLSMKICIEFIEKKNEMISYKISKFSN